MKSPSPMQYSVITRREALRYVSALLGGASLTGGANLLSAMDGPPARIEGMPGNFTVAEIAFLDEIAETILPATKTPGAKAAKTGAFMALMVTDSYSPVERMTFRAGMQKVDEAAYATAHRSFMAANPTQRLATLTRLDREQKTIMDARAPGDHAPPHYFRMMKELALLGYFTSEIGCKQAQRYVETPGRYDPCTTYTPGDPTWTLHA